MTQLHDDADVAATARRRDSAAASISTDGTELLIRIPLPDAASGIGAQLTFAARSDNLESTLRWCRYRAAHRALAERTVESDGDPGFNGVFDPFVTIAAEYSVAARVTQRQAEAFLERADDCFTRIPRIGECLRDALITARTFDSLRHETALIDDGEVLAEVDAAIADWIRGHGPHSSHRAGEAARRIVHRHDPDAARRRDEAKSSFKNAGTVPLDGRLSRFVVTADAADARLCQEVVDAVAAGVCEADPRTRAERRADAATALLQRKRFRCACDDPACPAATSDEEVAARCARIVLHVVVRKETLDGADDVPAYLDGDGPIAADQIAELRRRDDVSEQDLDLDELLASTAQKGDGHQPTPTCATAVRALFGTCSWPGCDRPAWRCDLDHVCEYDRESPESGGPTCFCNLNPKCRFHHLIKTHLAGWLDDQVVDAAGRIWTDVQTPSGVTARTEAANSWLLPEIGHLSCGHGPPAPTAPDAIPTVASLAEASPTESRTTPARSRTKEKHRYRMRCRARNRAARESHAEEVRAQAAAADDGTPPPF